MDAILVAWHERQVAGHLAQLASVRDRAASAAERLEAVLETYALILYEHHRGELAALLHQRAHVALAGLRPPRQLPAMPLERAAPPSRSL